MSLDIENFPFRDWGLRMGWLTGEDGADDLVLWQDECPNCGSDCYVRLNPCHFGPLAKELGLLTAGEAAQRVARLQDRLTLLAALVRAHSHEGSVLRTAVDALLAEPGRHMDDGHDAQPENPQVAAIEPTGLDGIPACSAKPADLFPATLKNQERIRDE